MRLLEKIVREEIHRRRRRNVARAKSFKELLDATLQKYHNRLLDAAAVIQAMVEMRKEWDTDDRRAGELGLSSEELAFYDAVTAIGEQSYADELLRSLIHQVVQEIKRNLKVDWTKPHRQQIKAGIRSAIKRTLARNGVKPEDFDRFTDLLLQQAEELYAEWPQAA